MSGTNPPPGPHGGQPYGPGQPSGQPGPYGQGTGQPGPYGDGQPGGYGRPPGGQPYANQPYGYPGPQQPPGGRPPGYPYGPGQPGGQPPRPGGSGPRSRRPLLIIGAAAAALALLAVIGIVALLNRDGSATTTTTDPVGPANPPASGASSAPNPPAASKASDAVRSYLEALAAGQAEQALALGKDQPADKTFLTNEVLAAANKRAPITAINVPNVDDENAYQVDASYTIGQQPVNETFDVSKAGGSWKIRDSFQEVDLSYQRAKTLPMTINGVPVKTDKVNLFPGSYEVSTGSDYVTYGEDGTLLLKGPTDYASSAKLRPTLTNAGQDAFDQAVRSAFKSCLDSKKLAPTGCPFAAASGGYKIDPDTIKWQLVGNEPFDNLRARLDYQNPALAIANANAAVRVTAKCSDSSGSCYKTRYLSLKPTVNMTKKPLTVVWAE